MTAAAAAAASFAVLCWPCCEAHQAVCCATVLTAVTCVCMTVLCKFACRIGGCYAADMSVYSSCPALAVWLAGMVAAAWQVHVSCVSADRPCRNVWLLQDIPWYDCGIAAVCASGSEGSCVGVCPVCCSCCGMHAGGQRRGRLLCLPCSRVLLFLTAAGFQQLQCSAYNATRHRVAFSSVSCVYGVRSCGRQ
ncbi:hypothetical protein COO60DRAFT_1481360 [Scenedesmus sp. NREL 46B-D3]|nr:hypothetical protein COO60DRAFT_1481360 [Scenedesmus sp. NREL 46B-D3]